MSSHPFFFQWRPHPWHGLEVGQHPPELVQAYIEITPFDVAKYELDKVTGYLRVNRLQKTSATPPTLYGLIPRTYCGSRVGALSPAAKSGDCDPLDICVMNSRQISHNDILLDARVIGGLQVVDGEEADDKIVSVLDNDDIWGNVRDISELPATLTERLRHYFLTYKMGPDDENKIQIYDTYGFEHVCQVIQAAMEDYQEAYGQGR
jgi:inorganic pyrophosphatase